jgi:hypothetical protein
MVEADPPFKPRTAQRWAPARKSVSGCSPPRCQCSSQRIETGADSGSSRLAAPHPPSAGLLSGLGSRHKAFVARNRLVLSLLCVGKRYETNANRCAGGFAHICVPTFTLIGRFSSTRRAWSNDTVRSSMSSTQV